MFKNLLLKLSGGIDLSYGKSGLGPNSWGWFRIILPYRKLFYVPACVHDNSYTKGGWIDDKQKTDRLFFKMCLENCHTDMQAIFAYLYYDSVRNFGKFFYNFHLTVTMKNIQ